MTIKSALKWIYTGLCALISVVFYVLFKQKKEEDKKLQEEVKAAEEKVKETEELLADEKAHREQLEEVNKLYNEGLKVEEQTIQDLKSDDPTVSIPASEQLLNDIRERSHNRNKDSL